MTEQQKVSNWNVPNVLTAVRMVMVPVFAWVLLAYPQDPTMRWVATAIFLIAIATDALDGNIARKYNLVTDFGKVVVSPLACAAGINASESATARAQEDNFSISFPMIGTVDGMCGAALPRLVLQEIEFDTSGNTRHNCQK